jgi:hypothetical protein
VSQARLPADFYNACHSQAIASQADVDTTVVDQAIQNRSGMPVRLN